MANTNLIYLDDFSRDTCSARVLSVTTENDKIMVTLDQTVFYPQGGGQPCDQGTISSQNSVFNVTEVRLFDGVVKHMGSFSGQPFTAGQEVTCAIDRARRDLNSRLHSAGHIIDLAVTKLGLTWVPGKAYHFPAGAYVEYAGSLAGADIELLKKNLERACAEVIHDGRKITARATTKEELSKLCTHVPDYIPADKPVRAVFFGDICSPCGGTHSQTVTQIGSITIRKIKESDGVIRVSYVIP